MVELVDVVTVLKDGKVAASAEESDVSIPFIVQRMVGDAGSHYPKERVAAGEVVLRVDDLVTENRVNGVSFSVRRGEVLGVGAARDPIEAKQSSGRSPCDLEPTRHTTDAEHLATADRE